MHYFIVIMEVIYHIIINVNLIGGISISQSLLSKGLEMAKARAKLVRSVINAAISTLNVNDMEVNT